MSLIRDIAVQITANILTFEMVPIKYMGKDIHKKNIRCKFVFFASYEVHITMLMKVKYIASTLISIGIQGFKDSPRPARKDHPKVITRPNRMV